MPEANFTKHEAIVRVTKQYLDKIDPSNPPEPEILEKELTTLTANQVQFFNAAKSKDMRDFIPKSLGCWQIAQVILKLYHVYRISCGDENTDPRYDVLAVYQTEGEDAGLYVSSDLALRQIVQQYNYNLTTKDFKEVLELLRTYSERRKRCENPDLIAVNNGIFNYKEKILYNFTPELVFLTKSRVNYNPNAQNVNIYNPMDGTNWNTEDWMQSLSDDPEIVNLLWEILGAIIRPYVRWNKSAWLYSTVGNNGKGTLCELMRNLCGKGSYASIPISDFGKDFVLEPLLRASAIIVDENDVGEFVEKAANLKAVITNDVIYINRKFKEPIAYQFHGFMVQCLNEFPKIKDKSDSFYRRQLFIPMNKCFTGAERKYIKADYLKMPEVLEYVLKRVLHMNYYSLSEPNACKGILDDYKEFNDPVRAFFEELSGEFVWDLLPFGFLYDLFVAWSKRNIPSNRILSKTSFITEIINIVNNDPVWCCKGRKHNIKTGNKMDKPETLIYEYNLRQWMSPTYTGNDINLMCVPIKVSVYRGLERCVPSTASPAGCAGQI